MLPIGARGLGYTDCVHAVTGPFGVVATDGRTPAQWSLEDRRRRWRPALLERAFVFVRRPKNDVKAESRSSYKPMPEGVW